MKLNFKAARAVINQAAVIAAGITISINGLADDANIDKWLQEFQPSSLTAAEQTSEIQWFINAAEPFKGMEIRVVSETIATHEYESKVLAKAIKKIAVGVVHPIHEKSMRSSP